jgi:hypothetical protein
MSSKESGRARGQGAAADVGAGDAGGDSGGAAAGAGAGDAGGVAARGDTGTDADAAADACEDAADATAAAEALSLAVGGTGSRIGAMLGRFGIGGRIRREWGARESLAGSNTSTEPSVARITRGLVGGLWAAAPCRASCSNRESRSPVLQAAAGACSCLDD